MIRVVAILTAKPGRRDDILALFKANVPAVLQEKGCLEYGPVIDAEGGGPNQTKFGPDTFVVIETWESLEALDAHRVAPHMVSFRAGLEGHVREPHDPRAVASLTSGPKYQSGEPSFPPAVAGGAVEVRPVPNSTEYLSEDLERCRIYSAN